MKLPNLDHKLACFGTAQWYSTIVWEPKSYETLSRMDWVIVEYSGTLEDGEKEFYHWPGPPDRGYYVKLEHVPLLCTAVLTSFDESNPPRRR
jgi:hypothetical protein